MTPPLHLYRQQQLQHEVEQASPVKLIVLLYDRAASLLQQALNQLKDGNMIKKGEAILKAVDILAELKAVLNTEEGGEIAEKLDGLYVYMIYSVTRANYTNDSLPIAESLTILNELRDSWKHVEQMVQKGELSMPVG